MTKLKGKRIFRGKPVVLDFVCDGLACIEQEFYGVTTFGLLIIVASPINGGFSCGQFCVLFYFFQIE